MKKQNIIRVVTMVLSISVPLALNASSSEATISQIQASISKIDSKWDPYVKKLNSMLGKATQEYYDVAIVGSNIDGSYEAGVGRVEAEIFSDIVPSLERVGERKKAELEDGSQQNKASDKEKEGTIGVRQILIDKENSQKIYALIEALRDRKGLSQSQKKYLQTGLGYFKKLLEDMGTPLSPEEIEAASDALEQVNSQEEWTKLLIRRIKEFLAFAAIDSKLYEKGKKTGGGISLIKGIDEMSAPIFNLIRTARSLGIPFDENDLQEVCGEMKALYMRSDLLKTQRMHIGSRLKGLLITIPNTGASVTLTTEEKVVPEEKIREELSTCFEGAGKKMFESFFCSSVFKDEAHLNVLNVLSTANRKGIEIKDDILLEFLDQCSKWFEHWDVLRSILNSFHRYDIFTILDKIPTDQQERLGDAYTRIKNTCLESES